MTMVTWKDLLVGEQRYKEMIERSQRAKWGLTFIEQSSQASTTDRWLYALGEQLVRWGCRLQARTRKVMDLQGVGAMSSSLNGSAASGRC
jgi:hypothetical protein